MSRNRLLLAALFGLMGPDAKRTCKVCSLPILPNQREVDGAHEECALTSTEGEPGQ